jgi:uncharacterized protein YndB with AHSA1/START domain
MKTLHFSIRIQAPAQRVWQLMLAPDTYREWTTTFCEGSYYEGFWEQGQRMRFLTPEGLGMFSEIAEYRPHEFISIRHLGELLNGVEAKGVASQWANARENYTFSNDGAAMLLQVDVDTVPEFEAYMAEAWPKALSVLKELCERQKA